MKNLTPKTAALTALLMAAILLTGYTNLNAAEKEKVITKNAIGNLKSGISSDNLGLRRSSIYYAGEYKVSEVIPELNNQLKKESDNKTKILIALVIYKLGDVDGISTVKKLALKDGDAEVRRMCASIYNAFVNDISETVATVNR